ncbi:MAG: alkaline phosphatase family protein [Pseudomonadota bacterium]
MLSSRVLVVVFDALRPEFVTPELMPNLSAFAERGARYLNARSTFPTETRVNQSAVTTGCMPWRHGIVGNKFVADDLQPGLLVNSGDDRMLEAAFAAGPVLAMPNIGQRLTQAGRRYAALSAGTPGGGRLINWSAVQDGTFRLAMRRPEACNPAGAFDRIADRIGPLPEYDLPATDWITWAVSAYLDYIEADLKPDAMLLWLCEPDETFHWKSIGGPEAHVTMAHADAEFGRILNHLSPKIEAGDMHIITLSDHGQISLTGEPLHLTAQMRGAGFSVMDKDDPEGEAILGLASAGGIWLPDAPPSRVAELVEWLRAQPWCGPLFTRDGVAGTLRSECLRLNHARAPDVSLVFRSDDTPNAHGVIGTTVHDAPYPEGGGCHGGLHAKELHTFLALGGTAFQTTDITVPGGNIDILPTVMHLMGLPAPDGLDGRVLSEAMEGGPDTPPAQEQILTSANPVGPRTHLSVTDIGTTRYLNRAWTK